MTDQTSVPQVNRRSGLWAHTIQAKCPPKPLTRPALHPFLKEQANSKGTGEDLPERAGISRREQDAHKRQVDPEAVRESEEEVELDPVAENEPEDGEKAA